MNEFLSLKKFEILKKFDEIWSFEKNWLNLKFCRNFMFETIWCFEGNFEEIWSLKKLLAIQNLDQKNFGKNKCVPPKTITRRTTGAKGNNFFASNNKF